MGSSVVPDGVAGLTLRFSSPTNAGDQGRQTSHAGATASVTSKVVGNVVVTTLPGGPYRDTPTVTIWKSATGSVIKTLH